jgi:hypothetical protein
MRNRGLTETDFLFGTQVIIGGFKARDGSLQAAGWIVTFPDREGIEGEEASFPLGR